MPLRLLPYGFLAFATTAVVGGLAAHRLLDRPGESALAFVPASAKGVAVLDLVPAPDQVLAFKHIEETIAAANGGKSAEPGELLASMVPKTIKPLAESVDRSAAFVWLAPADGKDKKGFDDADGVAILALKDPDAFLVKLKQIGKPAREGETDYFRVAPDKTGTGCVMVHDRYAIVTDKAWCLDRIGRVIRGQDPSLASDSAFAAVRGKALPSANLQVFVSPKVSEGDDWTVASMAIRETGLDVASSGQTNDPQVRKGGTLQPLGHNLLDALPRGAYGFVAMAQPGPAVALAGDALDDPAKEFQKETELDLRQDVLPALGGDVVVAFYPSMAPNTGLDLLVSVDGANGADPATLARKLEKSLDGEIAKENHGEAWKVATAAAGVPASRLADEPTNEMQKEFRGAERSFFRPLTLSRGKTVAWATVNDTVLLASSQDLLDRAVAARQKPSTTLGLSGDSALGASPASAGDGQFAFAMSMSRLAEGLRNTIDPSHMSPETATTYRRALGLFDATTEPLAIRASMAPDGHYRAFASIPMDWAKLPGLIK